MSNIHHVDLTFHCPMTWSQMPPVPGGRFCESCKFVVHDFTQSSQADLDEAIRKNPGRVCGRFRSKQMSTTFLQRAAVAALAATALGACTQEATDPVPRKPPIVEVDDEDTFVGVYFRPEYEIAAQFRDDKVELDSLRWEMEE